MSALKGNLKSTAMTPTTTDDTSFTRIVLAYHARVGAVAAPPDAVSQQHH
jgi:hypothetical protein